MNKAELVESVASAANLSKADAGRAVDALIRKGFVERIAPAGSVDNNGIVTFEVKVAAE